MSEQQIQQAAAAIETLIGLGWHWGDSDKGQDPKALMPSWKVSKDASGTANTF